MRIDSLSTFVAGLAAFGDRPALVERQMYRTRSYSYAELIGKALSFGEELRLRGIGRGDRVMLWGRSCAAWVIAFYGCLMRGAVVVPIDAAFSREYAGRVRNHTEARLVCTDLPAGMAFPEAEALDFESIAALEARGGWQSVEAAPLEDLLEIVYTSGATAEPKGVMITHGNVLANLRSMESELCKVRRWAKPFLRRLGFVHVIPLSHLFGQIMAVFIPQMMEARVIFPESLAPEALVAAIRWHRASLLVCVPQELELLADWAVARAGVDPKRRREAVIQAARAHWLGWRFWHWRCLRREFGWRMWAFLVGGASLPSELEDLWTALGYSVVQGYGLTETAPTITATHPFKVRRGAVGRRLAEVEIRIAEDGEILVRGPVVSPGYFRNPEASSQLFTDGWLHTGDLGRLDGEGNLIFLGRKKEIIVTADGLNVYPQDVEMVLNQQPTIRESAVVAEESNHHPCVHAVVVPRETGEDGLEHAVRQANQHLQPHQRIRSFSVWPGPELPRTASTRKLQRVAISRWVNRPADPVAPAPAARETWREFLAEKFHLRPERLTPEMTLDELGVSSLDRVELLSWLETRLHLTLDEQALIAARSVADLERLIAAAGDPAAAVRKIDVGSPVREGETAFRYPRWPIAPAARRIRTAARNTIVFPILRTQVTLQVEGREHLRALARPVVFIANHQSLFDTPAILRALPAQWRPWVAPAMGARDFREFLRPAGTRFRHRRRAYLKYVLTQAFFNGYLLAQEGGIRNALRHTGHLADRGYCPLIFPEGRETEDGRLHVFRPGIGVFVHELRLPVVPILIEGLFDVLPIGAKWPRRGRARILIGDVQRLAECDSPTITGQLQNWFAARLGDPAP